MQIIYKKTFESQLFHIVNYIAKDKISASINFAKELEELIFLIPDNPFKYKPSIYFDNKGHPSPAQETSGQFKSAEK